LLRSAPQAGGGYYIRQKTKPNQAWLRARFSLQAPRALRTLPSLLTS
jgi:hypothetical protein